MALQVRIASPCSEKWESMTGGERVRFCARCRLNVFNVKELTEVEVRALFLKAEGRVCGRVYRRPDGTVLTKDCPTGLAAVRRKALVAVTMAVALVLAVVGFRAKSPLMSPSDGGREGWFQRTLQARLIDARETLRQTRTLCPLIDELYPVQVMAGEMEALPRVASPGP
jgi:hypothetical protein